MVDFFEILGELLIQYVGTPSEYESDDGHNVVFRLDVPLIGAREVSVAEATQIIPKWVMTPAPSFAILAASKASLTV